MPEVRELSLQLRRMCAAVRASLETHVRAEEAEIWPLFSEHFTFAEQQQLVGLIIGRTGAEVGGRLGGAAAAGGVGFIIGRTGA